MGVFEKHYEDMEEIFEHQDLNGDIVVDFLRLKDVIHRMCNTVAREEKEEEELNEIRCFGSALNSVLSLMESRVNKLQAQCDSGSGVTRKHFMKSYMEASDYVDDVIEFIADGVLRTHHKDSKTVEKGLGIKGMGKFADFLKAHQILGALRETVDFESTEWALVENLEKRLTRVENFFRLAVELDM